MFELSSACFTFHPKRCTPTKHRCETGGEKKKKEFLVNMSTCDTDILPKIARLMTQYFSLCNDAGQQLQ